MGLISRDMKVLLGGAAITILLGAQAGRAQEAVQPPESTEEQQVVNQADKKGRVTPLQRIVLGAGEAKVAIDTPQAVSVLDQEDIDQKQPETVGELLKTIPSVNVSGTDRLLGQTFNIRGIGGPATGGEEGRILVNIDGTTKFFEQYRMGGLFTDPELFKRVEVLRGPASSTLYGAGALGGVINFTTKDASDFIGEGNSGALRLKGAYDSNSEGWLGSAIVAQRLNDNLEFLATGNYRYADAYTSGDGTVVPGSEIDAPSGLIKGTFRFGDGNEQVIRASYMHWVTDMADQFYSQTDNETGFGFVDRRVEDTTAILSYENPASDNPWLDLKIQVSHSDTVNDQSDASIPSLNRTFGYESYQYSLQNTFDYISDDIQNYLTVGVQGNSHDRTTLKSTSGTHPQGHRDAVGAFAQNEFIWNEKLTLIGGMRVDWQRLSPIGAYSPTWGPDGPPDREHTAYSPKIAAFYQATDVVGLFGSFAHTERVPTIDEVFDVGLASGIVLNKERSNNYEGGLAFSFTDVAEDGDALQIKTTAFYNDITDLIVDRGQSVVPRYANVGQAEIYGAEVEMAYDSYYFFGNASYSYVIGNNLLTGEPLDTIAPHTLAFTLGGRLPEHDLSFGWTSRFVAAQDRIPSTSFRKPTPSFSLHDIFLTWKPQNGIMSGIEANFRVDNLFNEQYVEYLAQGTPGKGRTFKVSLTKQFDW